MTKLNPVRARLAATGPIATDQVATIRTHEGAPAYVRDVQSELFLLGVTNFVGEDTFYESADARDARYEALVKQAALQHPEWAAGYLAWLRDEGNMRHAPIVGAAHFVHARLAADAPRVGADTVWPGDGRDVNRALIDRVLVRPDEPGDALALWLSTYGRAVPKPVKRGIGDGALRLYKEYGFLKYDTTSKGVRFADVLELTHPGDQAGSSQKRRWAGDWQGDLFSYALARRHNRDEPPAEALTMIRANRELRELAAGDPAALLDTERLKAAGMTWEDALSLVGSQVDKAKLWEALIPVMGYMALLRNLRNFDIAGISKAAIQQVTDRLTDPQQVQRSRQFPYRFLAAYEAVPSVRWSQALDEALSLSVANVPTELKDSLILVDTSASMTTGRFSKRSDMSPAKAAAVFGVALAMKGADLFGFADGQFRHAVPRASSLIDQIHKFLRRSGEVGHGTHIGAAIAGTFDASKHRRIFLISDMQTMDAVGFRGGGANVPDRVALYGFNLGGYRPAAFPTGSNRIELGGLSDATFKMVPLIEAGRSATWPWLQR